MEEKCVCSVQIWKEVFDYFDREPKKIEINENYSIDEDAKETLQEKKGRSEKGNGLGLSIVHQLVEKMGGSITVESLLGKGTEFMLLFPLDS